ncbi:hypothetical protein FBQ84_00425 [Ignavibacteria bacterium CHB1]|nr:MAG: hypothetical protein EDM69_00900 [Chlorobiota bacterium]MBV6398769.1 hypothetical protein [Ignavibacteria bacterium]MCC6885059.1 hypothetical protein [Ignavibacteriales bacterium]MCE7952150.1 hypothetical protein [Chlorobi bacterium CHB7]MDL1886293.1 hypothetical protein [Ignavibacteria bacterium CHB1]RIK49448.1 MAG: hypothetical protein DCC60_03885 [Ignavibacteriota bacterium]
MISKIIFLFLSILLLLNLNLKAADSNYSTVQSSEFFNSTNIKPEFYRKRNSITKDENSVIPIAIGVWSFLYLLNPTIQYEDDKLRAGITKEFSLGFGYFGEYRLGLEYSFIFKENQKSQLRFSMHYDYLLKDIEPSNMLQGTSVFTVGGSWFTDFDRHGAGPEVAYGYSIRNDKFLFYPHIKLRHTFMMQKKKSDITDLSFGIIIGIANPFIDLKIRRKN